MILNKTAAIEVIQTKKPAIHPVHLKHDILKNQSILLDPEVTSKKEHIYHCKGFVNKLNTAENGGTHL